ncbi:glycosyltransferase [Clostridium culturomicium]|uniref:glycosyltransferase n=1 Tax=Clostridium culturomicium TaxID=1499683 RepID=UPI0005917E24|nr:glycosyltransferase [Clostridium culturomicium]
MKADKNYIIYVGGFKLPNKNAAAHRVISNAKIFRELGYEVIFLGVNDQKDSTDISLIINNSEFECWEEKYPQGKIEWCKYLISISNIKELVVKQGTNKIKAIIAYNYPAIALFRLKLFCEKNNIRLISDCTEWYDAKNGRGILNAVKWMDTSLRMNIVHFKMDGIICISEYLYSVYKGKCKCILVPPLVDLSEEKWINEKKEMHDEIKIVYAGNPGINKKSNSKDRIDLIIKFLYKLKDKYNFKLEILGIEREEYLQAFTEDTTIISKLNKKVKFYGKINHNEVINKVKNADFVMFFRNNNRVSRAGFPTKFVEAISAGTPVITNKSSDLEEYLIEEKNGFFINLSNDEKAILQIEKILSLSKNKIQDMKKNCKEIEDFDFRNFKDMFESLFN